MARSKMSPRANAKDPPPFWEFSPEAFEELCCDLLSKESGISRCEPFGIRGQCQFGIDLKAWGVGTIEVAQCKAHKEFSPAQIRKAGEAFLNHWEYWAPRKVRRFILIVACDLRTIQCHKEIEHQEELFRQRGISFEPWSNRTLVQKLAPHTEIVARHFSEDPNYWMRKICGHEMPQYVAEATPTAALAPGLPGISEAGFALLAHRASRSVRTELESSATWPVPASPERHNGTSLT